MSEKYKISKKQKAIMAANALRKDNHYIISKIEKGQQKIIICIKCKKEFDLSDSEEYGAAVHMFEVREDMCVGCYYKKTGKLID